MDKETLDRLTDSFSDQEIADQLLIDRKAISYWRKKLNVLSFTAKTGLVKRNGESIQKSEASRLGANLQKGLKRNRSYKTDGCVTFFDELDTPAKAYFLGFIAADGCIRKSGKEVAILIHSKDAHILEVLRQESGFDSLVRDRFRADGERMVTLSLHSKHLVLSLAEWGLVPKKSLILEILKPIPLEVQRHFVRGVWDGDGYVGHRNFNLTSGSEVFLTQIQEMIYQNTRVRLTMIKPKGRNFQHLQGGKTTVKAIQWIYQDAYPVLDRKAIQFSRFWSS